jgi:hypothetical protein
MFKIKDRETLELLKNEYKFTQHQDYLYLYVETKKQGENFIYVVDIDTLDFTVLFELDKAIKTDTFFNFQEQPVECVEEEEMRDLLDVSALFDFNLLFDFIKKGIVVKKTEFQKNEDNSVEQLTS